MRKANINDVAAEAGVSIKTVSRVFNNEANVRAATRERVMEAAKRLNYTPSISARSLASRRSHVIVHFHDNPNPDYIERAYMGINKVCRDAGYFVVSEPLRISRGDYAEQAEAYLQNFNIDGAILTPPLSNSPKLISFLQDQNIPIVLIAPLASTTGISSVSIRDREAAEAVTAHLIGLGHSHIGFIAGPDNHHAAALRENGFKDGLAEAGLPLEDNPIEKGDFSFRSGFEAFERLLQAHPHLTAIFASNDDMAVGAMTAALKAGLNIPEQMSFAGFDASRVSEIVWPPMTTLRQPIKAMGARAAELLLEAIRGDQKDPAIETMAFELIVRGTTVAPPLT